ncbi:MULTISPECIES: hypothetical protein [Bacillaceae]|uniref:Uncharacterized protein n=1 Tax=Evansella alkalicola TaxID=745819 RepID=A0ABS6JWN2_9BACI|nr:MULTISPECIES: hypothetical protein [Bacillaceae]MBU9721530.1 hypothetical protein [Bacillus alkalicola]
MKNNNKYPNGNRMIQSDSNANKVVAFPSDKIYHDILVSQEEILDFAYSNYSDELLLFIEEQLHTLSEDAYLNQITTFFSSIWAIFYMPIENKGQTIFDKFIIKKRNMIKRQIVLDNIMGWKGFFTPVFGVLKQINGNDLVVECLFSNKTYTIPADRGNLPILGDYLLFFSIQVLGKQDKFLSYIKISGKVKDSILQSIEESLLSIQVENGIEKLSPETYINNYFPQFLSTLIIEVTEKKLHLNVMDSNQK